MFLHVLVSLFPSTLQVYDLWGGSILNEIVNRGKLRGPPPLPAPKAPLPGHAESYNPPAEYLMTEEEKREWNDCDPEDRETDFIPQKFDSLRKVPLYRNNVVERYEREGRKEVE